jgi:hypothetical protein
MRPDTPLGGNQEHHETATPSCVRAPRNRAQLRLLRLDRRDRARCGGRSSDAPARSQLLLGGRRDHLLVVAVQSAEAFSSSGSTPCPLLWLPRAFGTESAATFWHYNTSSAGVDHALVLCCHCTTVCARACAPMCCAGCPGQCTVSACVVRLRPTASDGREVRVCDVLPCVLHAPWRGSVEGRSVGARRDQCTVSWGLSSMTIYSISVAMVRPARPLGGLRSNVCVDEDIGLSCKEIQ